MRRALLGFAVVFLATGVVQAAGPEFEDDPFGDSDFSGTALIMDLAHLSEGRGQVGVFFSSSMIDKYSTHAGGTLDFSYNLMDTFGVGASLSLMNGALTSIVMDQAGIIGNKVDKCMRDGEDPCDARPNVPDFKQVTGSFDLYAIWTPLYGKVNVVSEADVNLEFYTLAGIGFNGTREPEITGQFAANGLPEVSNQGAFDGGLFSDGRVHGTFGLGLRVFLNSWFALRTEFRGLFFRDEFEFNPSNGPEGYTSSYWFGHLGADFVVF